MNGDYTKVPLRSGDRWTAARMQQGRVLLDHEWNLNIDASVRREQREALDAIGRFGVPRGSGGFGVTITTTGATEVSVAAGHMWVGGLLAVAPRSFKYTEQENVPALPASGGVLLYLDAFLEHVQPAEAPDELVEPALAPADSAARTRVGYRVRFAATTAASPRDAWLAVSAGLTPASSGMLSIEPAAQATPSDSCAPLGDPLAMLPDGVLRVEVLDKGDEKSARFAWSFENGAVAAPVAKDSANATSSPRMR